MAPRQRSRTSIDDGPGRDRTCDLGIKSPLLYRLSYRPAERVYRRASRLDSARAPID
jgi:hypothetical protein